MTHYSLTGFLLSLALAVPASAATYFVAPDGTGDFPTIQDAINGASPGDVIELGDGTFGGEGNRDMSFEGKAITIRSLSGNPGACIIDLNANAGEPHRGFSFTSGEGLASVLEGLTIKHGYISPGGGAVYIDHSSPTISACTFQSNQAHGGGGMWVYNYSDPDILGCVFNANSCTGQNGGGLLIGQGSDPLLEDCTFADNTSPTFGGAMLCYQSSSPTVRNCRFIGNEAPSTGGAVYLGWSSDAVFEACLFADNVSSLGGGAIRCYESSDPVITGCTFHANAGTYGGALYLTETSSATVEHTIIAFSTEGEAINLANGGWANLSCCDIYGNAGGDWVGGVSTQYGQNGNFSSDPLFCNADSHNCALQEESPCAPANNPGCGLVGQGEVGCGTQGIEEDGSRSSILSAHAWPNPSRGEVAIHYEIQADGDKPSHVKLMVYDAGGRLVRDLSPGPAPTGRHRVHWNGFDQEGHSVAEGIYFYRLMVGESSLTRHLVILK